MLQIENFQAMLEARLKNHVKAQGQHSNPEIGNTLFYNASSIRCEPIGQRNDFVKVKKDILSAVAIGSYYNEAAEKMNSESSVKSTTTNSITYVKSETRNSTHTFNIGLNLAYMGIGFNTGYGYNRGRASTNETSVSSSNTLEYSESVNLEIKKGEAITLLGEDCLIDVKTKYDLIFRFSGAISYVVRTFYYDNAFVKQMGNYVPRIFYKDANYTVSLDTLFENAPLEINPFKSIDKVNHHLTLEVPVKIHNINRGMQYHSYPTEKVPKSPSLFFHGISKSDLSTRTEKSISKKYKFQFFKDTQNLQYLPNTIVLNRPNGKIEKRGYIATPASEAIDTSSGISFNF